MMDYESKCKRCGAPTRPNIDGDPRYDPLSALRRSRTGQWSEGPMTIRNPAPDAAQAAPLHGHGIHTVSTFLPPAPTDSTPAHAPGVTEAWALISQERARQISSEGWMPEHDDAHENKELLHAAMIYLHWGTEKQAPYHDDEVLSTDPRANVPLGWPWDARWWKPKDRKSNLVRAGALMLAERERLLRKSPNAHVGHVDHKLDLCVAALRAALSRPASKENEK